MTKPTYISVAAAAGIIYIFTKLVQRRARKAKPLPPGPSGYPVIGNLLQWPKKKEWEVFTEWARAYGDLVYIKNMGQSIVLANSYEVARDILDRNGANNSDRPHSHFGKNMSGFGALTGLLDDSPALKEHRKIFAQEIGSKRVLTKFWPLIEAQTKHFVRNVLKNPSSDELFEYLCRLSGSIILDITYGYEAKDGEDDVIKMITEGVHEFSAAAAPGAHLVDQFPWLEHIPDWFPGMGLKEQARKYDLRNQELFKVTYDYVLENMAKGSARPSLVSSYIQSQGFTTDEQQTLLKYAAISLFGAGSDTSIQTNYAFFLNMVLYPEVQAKAQSEVDAFIEEEHRLPNLDDRPRLPYVNALITELFRRTSVSRQGLPHRSRGESTYNGYYVPKDTIIIPNIWYMCNNPEVYSNPTIFNPDRYLGKNPEPDPRSFVFGFGRRVCPGRLLVDSTVFMTCVTSLAVLDILPACDEAGNAIIPEEDWNGAIVAELSKFKCIVKARSAQKEKLVEVDS